MNKRFHIWSAACSQAISLGILGTPNIGEGFISHIVNHKHFLAIAGIGLMLAGLLVVLGLAAWWHWTGYWAALSFVDAIGLMSPSTAALATIALSENSGVLYFVFADTPLYGLLLEVGAALFVTGRMSRKIMWE